MVEALGVWWSVVSVSGCVEVSVVRREMVDVVDDGGSRVGLSLIVGPFFDATYGFMDEL